MHSSAPLPLASIVVVTFNHGDILRSCLRSLQEQDYPNREIIVVDNGSTDATQDILQSEFPGIRRVQLETNTGFAGGNNRGIALAKGRYIALINNDAVAQPTWLSALVTAAEVAPRAGAVGSLVIDGNAPDRLDSFGMGVALDGMSRQAMHGHPLDSPPTVGRDVLAISGCACLFRAEALQQTGLFDDRFFAYCEDTDLCLRLVRAGWQVVVVPEARVIHHYSGTIGAFSLQKVFWVERNHVWVAIKNFPPALLVLMPWLVLWRFLVQTMALARHVPSLERFRQTNGLWRILITVAGAHVAAWAGLPRIVASRLAFRPQCRLRGLRWAIILWRRRMTIYEAVTASGRPSAPGM